MQGVPHLDSQQPVRKQKQRIYMRQKIEELINSLMDDCLETQSSQELFNALSRLEKGAHAISALVDAQTAVNEAEMED
jgi:hypothetical protein